MKRSKLRALTNPTKSEKMNSDKSHKIRLTQREMIQGAFVASMRQIENLGKGRREAYGCTENKDWQFHAEGALGEMAFSKARNVYWCGAHAFRGDDADDWNVRTRSLDWYDLLLHPDDPDDKPFALLTGMNGIYLIRGWIWGGDGKNSVWWGDKAKNGRPAYFVPQSALTPFLPEELVVSKYCTNCGVKVSVCKCPPSQMEEGAIE